MKSFRVTTTKRALTAPIVWLQQRSYSVRMTSTRSRSIRFRWFVVVSLGSALLLSACGGGSSVPSAGQGTDLPGSWVMYRSGSSADLLTWTINGTNVHGNLEESVLYSSQTQVSSTTSPFTGSISASSVNLVFASASTATTGTVTSSSLILDVPTSSGTVQQDTFAPGTIGSFNSDVQSLQSSASSGQQVQAQNQQVQHEQSSINQDAHNVAIDLGSISSYVSALQADEVSLSQDVSTLNSDLNTVKSDANIVNGDISTNNGSACGDAGSAQGDAGSVQGDFGSLQGDTQTFGNDVNSLQSSSSQLASDWNTFKAAQTALPNFSPNDAITQSQVSGGENVASSAISKFESAAANSAAQGQALVNHANQIANSLLSKACN